MLRKNKKDRAKSKKQESATNSATPAQESEQEVTVVTTAPEQGTKLNTEESSANSEATAADAKNTAKTTEVCKDTERKAEEHSAEAEAKDYDETTAEVEKEQESATSADAADEANAATDEAVKAEAKAEAEDDSDATAEPQVEIKTEAKNEAAADADKSEAKDAKDENEAEAEESVDAAPPTPSILDKKKDTPAEASTSVSQRKKKETKSLAKSEDSPINDKFKSRIIVITSGKGGVGKTTSAAAISTGLALKGHKTAVIDFDVGLRNLDLIMGCERRVVYDFINVIHKEARLNQALIKDKNTDDLFILPASQTKDKDSLTYEGVGRVLKELSDMDFEYIICDSPAGIETGALIALYYADEAIVTTNPEVSSVRDSDRIIGILNAKSRRAVNDWDPVEAKLLLTRYIPSRVDKEEMLSIDAIQGLLNTPLLGVIPESPDVLKASNSGESIILNQKSEAGLAYSDAVERLLGNNVPLRFVTEQKSFWKKLFG